MKKCIAIALSLIMVFSMVACGAAKHSGFIADGDNFSAQVNDGELVLDLKKDTESDTWVCEEESDLFAIDYSTEHDDRMEFHITSLDDGSDTIAINHMSDDDSAKTYNLTLEISRQGKNHLIINSISFVEAD